MFFSPSLSLRPDSNPTWGKQWLAIYSYLSFRGKDRIKHIKTKIRLINQKESALATLMDLKGL